MSVSQKNKVFDKQKSQCLAGVDLSKKGSVDAPIQPLIQYINALQDYFTTSSCSGRIMVVENTDLNGLKKKGCKWLFSSHGKVILEELQAKLCEIEGDAVFKFEPFVLHVQCRSLADAQYMMSCGITSGYRNSGISVSTKGKCIVAIRSTHSLEVPLSYAERLLVSEEYLAFLVTVANQKMEDNFALTERFFSTLKSYMEEGNHRRQQAVSTSSNSLNNQSTSAEEQSQIQTGSQLSQIGSNKSGLQQSSKREESVTQSTSAVVKEDCVEENIDDICDLFGEPT